MLKSLAWVVLALLAVAVLMAETFMTQPGVPLSSGPEHSGQVRAAVSLSSSSF